MANYSELLPELDAAWSQVLPHIQHCNNEHRCLTTNFARGKDKDYQQVRFKLKKYYCHIIACMKNSKRAPSAGEEASHICHNPTCVEPTHLVFEDGDVNKSRGCCKLYGDLHGYKCPHNPVCKGAVGLYN